MITIYEQDRDLRYTWMFTPKIVYPEHFIGENRRRFCAARGCQTLNRDQTARSANGQRRTL